MPARWSIAAFDWTRFRALEPPLRAAVATGDFTRIEDAEAVEILSEVEEGSEAEAIANALITELCTSEEVLFDTGLSALLSWLRRQPRGEDPAELIGTLISAAPGIEDWYTCDGGLVGILTAHQTGELAAGFVEFRKRYKPSGRPGGLNVVARYFKTADPARENLDDLMNLVDEAAARSQGLCAIAEL